MVVPSREMAKAMTRPGDMLLGRRTWQDFTAAWGRRTDGNPVTARMNASRSRMSMVLGVPLCAFRQYVPVVVRAAAHPQAGLAPSSMTWVVVVLTLTGQ